jgi:hypothetical protein
MKSFVIILSIILFPPVIYCKKPVAPKPVYKINNSDELLNTTPKNYSGPEIVRLAWGSIPESFTSLKRYGELRDAGFTHSFHYYMSGTAAVTDALNMAQQAGVKIIITCPELYSNPESTVALFKNHQALWGYFISDEPADESELIELSKISDRVRSADPSHPCYMNLKPGGLSKPYGTVPYADFLDSYNNYFKPEVISFDHYPISIPTGDTLTVVSNKWYDNLEVVSSFSRSKNKPFWAFVLSVPHQLTKRTYPTPTLAHMRLQAFSDLAYGAQGIQYFTYWQPVSDPNSDEKYFPGPIAVDGTKTGIYDLVKTINKEIRDLSFVFIDSKVNWVRTVNITQAEQKNTFPLTQTELSGTPITSILAEAGCLVSQIDKGDTRYLVIVNYSLQANQVKVATSGSVKRILKNGASVDAEERINLFGGDMIIYTWKK